MPRPLNGAAGERLELADYYTDILDHYAHAREFWKLERGQVYAEPDDASWRAFDRGDWEESLRLTEERRPERVDAARQDAARGLANRRVRIVSLPLSDYLLWELYLLRMRAEAGEEIRILLDREVANLEDRGPLPDLNVLDTGTMYQLVYDDNGVAYYALRYTGESLVRRCRDFVADLFGRGEPIADFFKREVAHLPPPSAQRAVPHDYFELVGRPEPPRS
jgi:hypothetical protein